MAIVLDGTVGITTPTEQAATTIGVGNATPSTSGAGITFPATQSASTNANTLDDYEEGTWTPVLNGFTTTGPTTLVGRYTKVGNVVTVYCSVAVSGTVQAIAGTSYISGLPFNVAVQTGCVVSNYSSGAGVGVGSIYLGGLIYSCSYGPSGAMHTFSGFHYV
jgi:hypothetical protein